MAWNFRVVADEEFKQEEKGVYNHCVHDDGGQLLDRFLSDVEVGEFLHYRTGDQDQGRSGGKGRGQKARSDDG